MLWRILQAHGGVLPPDVVVCFANTGREMPATLDFVRDCAEHWGVPIVWLEYRRGGNSNKPYAAQVDYATAARAGEPFEVFLASNSALPNPVQRSCTAELKVRTIKRWIIGVFGWPNWISVLGLRWDEPARVEKRQTTPSRERWTDVMPLYEACITKPMVLAFWEKQPFDLALAGPWEGNCDGCFMKSRGSIMWMMRTHPARMAWWRGQEAIPRGVTNGVNRRFRNDREPYAVLADEVERTPLLPMDETMHELGSACESCA